MEDKSLIIILAENKPGMLASFTKVFSDNELNIDSLSLSKINWDNTIHRTTAYIQGSRRVAEKASKELEGIEGVRKVVNFIANGTHMERELGMIKMLSDDPHIGDATRIVSDFGGSTIFSNEEITIFEITDFEETVSDFIGKLSEECEIEVMRSGVVATTLEPNLLKHE